jgi:phospholipase C
MLSPKKFSTLLATISFLLLPALGAQNNSIMTTGTGGSSANAGDYFTVAPAVAAPGQFVNFSWSIQDARTFVVTPSLLAEDQTSLPLVASRYPQVAPDASTLYEAVALGGRSSATLRAPLTIVPITLTAPATTVAAGGPLVLRFTGPNNGSHFFLTTLPENSITPLHPDSCSGTTCVGTYLTGPLGSNKTFMVGATGPMQGQGYSQPLSVTVPNGMTLACSARPVVPAPGEPVTIFWSSTNATSVRINQGVGEVTPAVAGSVVVHPTQTSTYTCTANDGRGDQLSKSARVIVSTGDVHNLNHIVFLLQENRAFDNYFGNLAYYRVNIDQIPGAQMSDVNDLHNLPSGYTLQNPQGQSFPPFHERTECIEGLNPQWNESHLDMDLVGGDWMHLTSSSQFLMDKFLFTTGFNLYDPTESRPLGYYDWTDLPFYYELAAQFNTSDTFYSPLPDATTINRSYLFAGTSYGNIFPPLPNNWMWLRPTIFRVLQTAGISWRYYYQDNSVFLAQWADYSNPQIQANVRNIQEWYNILASDGADSQLPQVVFIERASATGYDEHPGNNIQTGAARVQQILTPLLISTAWPDSVFILTYDEGGGTYDQQPPILVTPPDDKVPMPQQNQPYIRGLFNVTGFRLPNIIVSPWSKAHTVFHQQTDYTSILKLIETRFSLAPLTHRDQTAADLTDQANGPFDFNTPEMLIVPPLPTQPTNGTCNYSLESYPQ